MHGHIGGASFGTGSGMEHIKDGDDITDLFRAAQAKGGRWFLPPGRYFISDTIDVTQGSSIIGAGPEQTILVSRAPNCAFRLGHYAALSDMTIEADPSITAYETTGVVLPFVHKPSLRRLLLRHFSFAAVLLDGAQNALLLDVFVESAKIAFWFVNETRTVTLLNCNVTDCVKDRSSVLQSWEPDARAIVIGFFDQAVVQRRGHEGNYEGPSNLTFINGIFERYRYHDYIVDVRNGWGRMMFQSCEFTHSRKSLVRLDPKLRGRRRKPLVGFDICEFIGWPEAPDELAVDNIGKVPFYTRLCSTVNLRPDGAATLYTDGSFGSDRSSDDLIEEKLNDEKL